VFFALIVIFKEYSIRTWFILITVLGYTLKCYAFFIFFTLVLALHEN
jgi:hypothetical protein